MKIKKFLSFLLVAAMMLSLLSLLVACGEEEPDPTPGPDGEMKFGGKTLTVSISTNQDSQTTFPAANIYTMGPDKSQGNVTDSVQKKVIKRNDNVAKELDIKVEYQTTNLTYDLVAGEVDKIVLGSAADAPDIFNNDIYGLTRSMMAGNLYNIKNPGVDDDGNPITSYFDFTDDGWYQDYMNGATFDQEKLFILAGDYFIDIIRFAWVLFVNKQLFDAAYADTSYGTYEDVCNAADLDYWSYDDLIDLSRMGLVDRPGGMASKAEENDTRVPMYLNNLSPRIFFYGSGVSVVKWDSGKFGKGTPSIIGSTSTQMDDLITLSEKYSELFNATGVYYKNDVIASTSQFMKGNIIMSMCELGEMESDEMRATGLSRGILPFPTYKIGTIHTVVHDQAEIGVILNTTTEFPMASAYMQRLNEESADVLKDYYENSLKFKYSDGDEATLTMIDKVHDTIDSPFDSVIVPYLCGLTESGTMTYGLFQTAAESQSSNFRAEMTSQIPQLQQALTQVLENYKKKVV